MEPAANLSRELVVWEDRSIVAARVRTRPAAMLLIAAGVVSFALGLASLYLAAEQPWLMYDQIRDYMERQPASKERADTLKHWDANRDDLRLDTPWNLAINVIGLPISGLMILGGVKLYSLKVWWLALAAGIACLLPLHGLRCFAMPIGVWAVIVLFNGRVLAGYDALARRNR